MTRKKTNLEKDVNLYYTPSSECYIKYSSVNKISSESDIEILDVKAVKSKFGFNLLCEDFLASMSKSEARHNKLKIDIKDVLSRHKLLNDNGGFSILEDSKQKFVLYNVSPLMGLGLTTMEGLPKGEFITEYVGKRIFSFSMPKDSSYVFYNNDGTKTDTKHYGNAARFINHCPSKHDNEQVLTANLVQIGFPVSEELSANKKAVFLTTRDIKPGEPLCYDYGESYQYKKLELLDSKTYLPISDHDL